MKSIQKKYQCYFDVIDFLISANTLTTYQKTTQRGRVQRYYSNSFQAGRYIKQFVSTVDELRRQLFMDLSHRVAANEDDYINKLFLKVEQYLKVAYDQYILYHKKENESVELARKRIRAKINYSFYASVFDQIDWETKDALIYCSQGDLFDPDYATRYEAVVKSNTEGIDHAIKSIFVAFPMRYLLEERKVDVVMLTRQQKKAITSAIHQVKLPKTSIIKNKISYNVKQDLARLIQHNESQRLRCVFESSRQVYVDRIRILSEYNKKLRDSSYKLLHKKIEILDKLENESTMKKHGNIVFRVLGICSTPNSFNVLLGLRQSYCSTRELSGLTAYKERLQSSILCR